MKTFLLIACLFGAASLMGCMTTTQTRTTHTPTVKADAKQTQNSGSYWGGGIGLGVMAF